MPPLAVLFDFDGTLVQTREASWKIFERVNAAFKLGVTSQQDYFRLLEDNLFKGIRRLCRDDAHAQEVALNFLGEIEAHYEPDFVPGMADVVRTLAANCSLAVVSSNTTKTIRRLLTRARHRPLFLPRFRWRCRTGQARGRPALPRRQFLFDQPRLLAGLSRRRPARAGVSRGPRPRHGHHWRCETRQGMWGESGRRRLGHAPRKGSARGRRRVCRRLAAGVDRAPPACGRQRARLRRSGEPDLRLRRCNSFGLQLRGGGARRKPAPCVEQEPSRGRKRWPQDWGPRPGRRSCRLARRRDATPRCCARWPGCAQPRRRHLRRKHLKR